MLLQFNVTNLKIATELCYINKYRKYFTRINENSRNENKNYLPPKYLLIALTIQLY